MFQSFSASGVILTVNLYFAGALKEPRFTSIVPKVSCCPIGRVWGRHWPEVIIVLS